MFCCTFQLVRKAFAKIIMSIESYKLKVESLITRGVAMRCWIMAL